VGKATAMENGLNEGIEQKKSSWWRRKTAGFRIKFSKHRREPIKLHLHECLSTGPGMN
jgi:hypothetical protein